MAPPAALHSSMGPSATSGAQRSATRCIASQTSIPAGCSQTPSNSVFSGPGLAAAPSSLGPRLQNRLSAGRLHDSAGLVGRVHAPERPAAYDDHSQGGSHSNGSSNSNGPAPGMRVSAEELAAQEEKLRMMQEALSEMMRNTQRMREAMEAQARLEQQQQQQQQQQGAPQNQGAQQVPPSAQVSSPRQVPTQQQPGSRQAAAPPANQAPAPASSQDAAPKPGNVNGKRAVLMNPEVFAKIQAAQVLHEEMVSMFKSKAKGSKAERNAVAAVRDAAVQSSTQQPPSTTSPGEQDAPSDDEPEDDVGDDGMAAQVNSGAEAPLTTASTQLPPQHQAAPPQMADELVGLPRLVGRKVVFGIQGPTMDWLESKVLETRARGASVPILNAALKASGLPAVSDLDNPALMADTATTDVAPAAPSSEVPQAPAAASPSPPQEAAAAGPMGGATSAPAVAASPAAAGDVQQQQQVELTAEKEAVQGSKTSAASDSGTTSSSAPAETSTKEPSVATSYAAVPPPEPSPAAPRPSAPATSSPQPVRGGGPVPQVQRDTELWKYDFKNKLPAPVADPFASLPPVRTGTPRAPAATGGTATAGAGQQPQPPSFEGVESGGKKSKKRPPATTDPSVAAVVDTGSLTRPPTPMITRSSDSKGSISKGPKQGGSTSLAALSFQLAKDARRAAVQRSGGAGAGTEARPATAGTAANGGAGAAGSTTKPGTDGMYASRVRQEVQAKLSKATSWQDVQSLVAATGLDNLEPPVAAFVLQRLTSLTAQYHHSVVPTSGPVPVVQGGAGDSATTAAAAGQKLPTASGSKSAGKGGSKSGGAAGKQGQTGRSAGAASKGGLPRGNLLVSGATAAGAGGAAAAPQQEQDEWAQVQALAADLVLRIQPGLTRLPPSALVSVVEASGLLLGPSARPLWVQAVTFVVEQVTPRLSGPDLVSAAHGLALLGAEPSLDWISLFWKESEAHMCERRLTHPSYLADLAAAGAALLVAGKRAAESAAQPAWITGGTGAAKSAPQPSAEWSSHLASAYASSGQDKPNWEDDRVSTHARLFLSMAALEQAAAHVAGSDSSTDGAAGRAGPPHQEQQQVASEAWAAQLLEAEVGRVQGESGPAVLQQLSSSQLLALPATLAAGFAGEGRPSPASSRGGKDWVRLVEAVAEAIAGRLHDLPLSSAVTALFALSTQLPPGTSLPSTVRLSLAQVTLPARAQAAEEAASVTGTPDQGTSSAPAAAASPALQKLSTQQLWEVSLLLTPPSGATQLSNAQGSGSQTAALARTVAGLLASRADASALGPLALVRCLEAVAAASAAAGTALAEGATSNSSQREVLALATVAAEVLSSKAGEVPVVLFSRMCSALAVACPPGTSLGDCLQPLEVFLQQSLRAWAAARTNASAAPASSSVGSDTASQQDSRGALPPRSSESQLLPPGSWVEVVAKLGALAECDPGMRVRPMVMQPLLAAAATEVAWFQGNAAGLAACFKAAAAVQGFTAGDAQARQALHHLMSSLHSLTQPLMSSLPLDTLALLASCTARTGHSPAPAWTAALMAAITPHVPTGELASLVSLMGTLPALLASPQAPADSASTVAENGRAAKTLMEACMHKVTQDLSKLDVPSLASLVTAITATVGQSSTSGTTTVSVTAADTQSSSSSALGQFVSAIVSASLPLLATATPSSVANLAAALSQDQALQPLLATGSPAAGASLAAWLHAAQDATAGYLGAGPESDVSRLTWGVARLARAAALLAPSDKQQAARKNNNDAASAEHQNALLVAARASISPGWRAALAQRVGPQKPGVGEAYSVGDLAHLLWGCAMLGVVPRQGLINSFAGRSVDRMSSLPPAAALEGLVASAMLGSPMTPKWLSQWSAAARLAPTCALSHLQGVDVLLAGWALYCHSAGDAVMGTSTSMRGPAGDEKSTTGPSEVIPPFALCPPASAPAVHVLLPLAQQSAALAASSTAAVPHQQGQYHATPEQVICMASTLVCLGLRGSYAVGKDSTKEQVQALEAAAASLSAAVQFSVDTLLGGNQHSSTAVPPALLVGALWVQAQLGGRPSSSWVASVLDRLVAAPASSDGHAASEASSAPATHLDQLPPLQLSRLLWSLGALSDTLSTGPASTSLASMQARVVGICATKLTVSHGNRPQARDASTAQGSEEASGGTAEAQTSAHSSGSSTSTSAGPPGVFVPLSGAARRRQEQARKQGSATGAMAGTDRAFAGLSPGDAIDAVWALARLSTPIPQPWAEALQPMLTNRLHLLQPTHAAQLLWAVAVTGSTTTTTSLTLPPPLLEGLLELVAPTMQSLSASDLVQLAYGLTSLSTPLPPKVTTAAGQRLSALLLNLQPPTGAGSVQGAQASATGAPADAFVGDGQAEARESEIQRQQQQQADIGSLGSVQEVSQAVWALAQLKRLKGSGSWLSAVQAEAVVQKVTSWAPAASTLEDCARLIEASAQLCPRSLPTATALVTAVESQSLELMRQLCQHVQPSASQAEPGPDGISTAGGAAAGTTNGSISGVSGATLVRLLQGVSDAGHTPSPAWTSAWAACLTPGAMSDMPDSAVVKMVTLLHSGLTAALTRMEDGTAVGQVLDGKAAAQLMAEVPDASWRAALLQRTTILLSSLTASQLQKVFSLMLAWERSVAIGRSVLLDSSVGDPDDDLFVGEGQADEQYLETRGAFMRDAEVALEAKIAALEPRSVLSTMLDALALGLEPSPGLLQASVHRVYAALPTFDATRLIHVCGFVLQTIRLASRALRFAEQCGKNTQELESELEERQGELTQQEKQQLLAQKAEWKELADSSFKLGVQRLAIIYTPLQNTLRMVFNENHLTTSYNLPELVIVLRAATEFHISFTEFSNILPNFVPQFVEIRNKIEPKGKVTQDNPWMVLLTGAEGEELTEILQQERKVWVDGLKEAQQEAGAASQPLKTQGGRAFRTADEIQALPLRMGALQGMWAEAWLWACEQQIKTCEVVVFRTILDCLRLLAIPPVQQRPIVERYLRALPRHLGRMSLAELAALADVMAKNEITPERPLLDSWLAAVKQAVAAEAQEEGVAPDAYILPALVLDGLTYGLSHWAPHFQAPLPAAGGLIAGLTGGKAGPPPYPVDDQLGALLVRSLEACAAETTAAYAAAEAAASAALDNPAQAPAPVAAGPNVMPQGAQDVVEVLGYLAQLSGTQGGRGLGDLSRDRLRQCLEAHVVPALWRGDVDSEALNLLLDGLAKQGLRAGGPWSPPDFIRAVCHAVKEDVDNEGGTIVDLGKVAASLFRLGAEVPSDWVASLSQQVRQYTEANRSSVRETRTWLANIQRASPAELVPVARMFGIQVPASLLSQQPAGRGAGKRGGRGVSGPPRDQAAKQLAELRQQVSEVLNGQLQGMESNFQQLEEVASGTLQWLSALKTTGPTSSGTSSSSSGVSEGFGGFSFPGFGPGGAGPASVGPNGSTTAAGAVVDVEATDLSQQQQQQGSGLEQESQQRELVGSGAAGAAQQPGAPASSSPSPSLRSRRGVPSSRAGGGVWMRPRQSRSPSPPASEGQQ